jgi:radical SAM protein with 4Fe4S-binding SPASM domain
MQSTSGRYGELPFTEMVRLIEQFEQANVLQVSLSGGEPFIRKDIIDIIELLANKKIWLSYIYSNGLLITEDHLKEIKRVGFAPNFQISFDGVGVHDQMRGVYGVESGVIESIKRIRDVGFPLIIATSIDKTNIERLAETYELLKELGIQSWRIGTPRDAGNWRGATTALQLDEQAKACEQLLNRWLKDGKPFYIQLAGFYAGGPLLNEATSICDLGLATSAPTDSVCSESTGDYLPDTADFTPNCYDCIACREQPNLLPDGTLVPCPGYVDIVELETMPNLLREGLSKAWSKSYLREIVDLKKKDLLTKNPECAICELFKNCGMGCRALAFTETGDLMAKDPISCELWKNGIK